MGQERPRRGARSLGLVSSPEKREPPPTQQSREAPLPGLHFCIPPSAKSTGRTGLGLRDPRGGGSQASLSTNCEKNGKAWNADLNRSRWVFFPTQWESNPVRATHTAQLGTQGGRLGLWSRHRGTRAWVTGTPTLSQDTRDKGHLSRRSGVDTVRDAVSRCSPSSPALGTLERNRPGEARALTLPPV